MQKWLISKLEKRILKNIKRNHLSLGVDIAYDGNSGWVITFTDDKNLYLLDKGIFNTKKLKIVTDKLDKINDETKKMATKFFQETSLLDSELSHYQAVAVVEHPYVGKNARVAIVLGLAAGIAYLNVRQVCKNTYLSMAKDARKKIGVFPSNGKKEVVQRYFKNNFKFEDTGDIVDGFALAYSALIVEKSI